MFVIPNVTPENFPAKSEWVTKNPAVLATLAKERPIDREATIAGRLSAMGNRHRARAGTLRPKSELD